MNTAKNKPHKRLNPLTGDWILVSPHRTKRPWSGQQESTDIPELPQYDSGCYLCPGNERAGGERNPNYSNTYVFTNDFAAILPESSEPPEQSSDGLFTSQPETGICRVICYSPRHDLSMGLMPMEEISKVIDVWQEEYSNLGNRENIGYVQIFENRGTIMGCSNPHPHGQIWATRDVPTIPAKEQDNQAAYLDKYGQCMLCRYVQREMEKGERIIFANDSFAVLVPYWAVWPFETMILPLEHIGSVDQMTAKQQDDLARAMSRLAVRYDNLFQIPFPYSMGLHQCPTDGTDHPEWHFHIHYYPPLLRSSTVRKFMVGYEMMAMPQRDITAEDSAKRLRELSETHYTKG